MEASRLEDVQGLYGPVCLSELVVQKLWLRQDLDPRGLKTADGLPVEVHFPGEWNRLGGPDFRHAELTMGGQRRVGDIELHFHARDWFAHGHHTDPAYNQVILHLLVFPPRVDEPAVHREDGGDVPHLWLTPHCREDLEAYALADAIGALGQADLLDVAAPWLERPLGERRQQIITTARTRWEQKTHWAAQRLAEASWEEAVHQWTLEVLGYRRNRVPMATVATAFPASVWAEHPPEPALAMQAAEGLWKKQGIRPANQPHVRLAQYRGLWEKSPDWPAQLQHWATHTPTVGDAAESTRAFRSRQRKAQTHILPPTQMLIDAGIGLRKAQTILLDAWLPLAAALTGQTDAWFASWYHAVPGDLPDAIQALAKLLHLAQSGRPSQPMSHGLGQGLLPVLLDVRKKRGDR